MKNTIFPLVALFLSMTLSQHAAAGKNPKNAIMIQGRWMYEKSCYVGSLEKVCEMLEIAAYEASDKSGDEVKLHSCKGKQGPGRNDRIQATFLFKSEYYTTNLIPVCEGLGISDDPLDVGI